MLDNPSRDALRLYSFNIHPYYSSLYYSNYLPTSHPKPFLITLKAMDDYNYTENLETFFHTFIDLPQPRVTPSGHLNHWHFSFQPFPGPRDLSILFIVNTSARIGHNAGILDLHRWFDVMRVERMSKLWLILILRTFARPHVGQLRPWSWSTNSSFMVDQITDALGYFNLDGKLPIVTLSEEMESIATATWTRYYLFEARNSPS